MSLVGTFTNLQLNPQLSDRELQTKKLVYSKHGVKGFAIQREHNEPTKAEGNGIVQNLCIRYATDNQEQKKKNWKCGENKESEQ